MAAGPFMYLYFASIFRDDFKFKRIHLLHFLPSLLLFINGTDYLFWDSTQKAKLIQGFMADSHAVFNMPTLIIPYYWHVIFRMVQTLSYVIACCYLYFVSFKANGFD
jgi:hypothetical protein